MVGNYKLIGHNVFMALIGYYLGTISGGERDDTAMLTVLLAGVDIRNYMVDMVNRQLIVGFDTNTIDT